jgi:hypothetical protein
MPYVMLAVPADLVPAVTEFIEGQGGAPSGESASDQTADSNALIHHWTADRLHKSYRATSDRMRDVLKYLASRAGTELSAEDVVEGVGIPNGWRGLAGVLSGFGRTCKRLWGDTSFPWEIRYVEGTIRMNMPEDVSNVIREAAGSAS